MESGQTRLAGDFEFRYLTAVAEFDACVALQSAVWGFAERDLVPSRMFAVARKIGGSVLGAWHGATLAGFTLAFPGQRQGQMYWHSHMLAVSPDFRDRGLGRQLKLRQREHALAQGLDRIEWTFDPLEIKNGYFNIAVLGATASHYEPNFYGHTTSALQAGLPSDRLTAVWKLRSDRVAQLARDLAPPPIPIQSQVEVPVEIQAWKDAGDPRAAQLQARNRHAFLAAFARGLAVVGYLRRREGGAFLLGREEYA